MPITLDPNDTIAAVSSPPGPSTRGIVRLSGPQAWTVALDAFRPESEWPAPRYPEIRPGEMRIDGLRPSLPVMLALWPPPRTYTGQPMAEIHLIGSPPLLRQVLGHCLARGTRLAEPGEFTLRAFLSGRIDLTRAEAVLGVIEAASPIQLDAALHQLAGGLAVPILALRDHLLDLVAHLEANLDFTEESDVDPIVRTAMAGDLEAAAVQLAALARQLDERDRPEGHPRVVLGGPPNAGKSRLFNAMAGKDHAIVSPQAGTTRDYLTALCDCGGLTIELVDTAGIEEGCDEVGRLAQRHRQRQFELADLRLDCWPAPWGDRPAVDTHNRTTIRVRTRCDEFGSEGRHLDPQDELPTSAATGAGVEALKVAIERALQIRPAEGILPAGTAARCRGSLIQAEAALRTAMDSVLSAAGDELVAFDLRLAAEELGKVVGAVVTDDILDRIFRRFCIGK